MPPKDGRDPFSQRERIEIRVEEREQERRTLRDPSAYDKMIESAKLLGSSRRPGAVAGVGGADQRRQLRDDPMPAAERATTAVRRVRLLRSAGGDRCHVGAGVLGSC
jgi:hypothetical protein